MTKAVAVIEKVSGTALEVYADRQVVRELVTRLMSFHPAAQEVGEKGMIQAAQLAILMGASPLPSMNEIHIWKDNRGNTIVAPGVNYWKRRATQQGGVWWDFEARPMTESEREAYGLQDYEVGAICRGVKMADLERAIAKGIPWQAAVKSLGKTGVGVVSTERWNSGKGFKEQKSGRPLWWTAGKRAETDCLKTLFPYIPGERMDGGAGMRQRDDGTYEPTNDVHWAGLDLSLDEHEIEEGEYTVEEVNSMFGLGDNGDVAVTTTESPWDEVNARTQDANEPAEPPQKAAMPQNGSGASHNNNGHDMTPPDPEKVAFWREKCAGINHATAGTVASMVANCVPYYENMHHALGHTDYESGDRLDNGAKLELFDALVEKALELVTGDEEK